MKIQLVTITRPMSEGSNEINNFAVRNSIASFMGKVNFSLPIGLNFKLNM